MVKNPSAHLSCCKRPAWVSLGLNVMSADAARQIYCYIIAWMVWQASVVVPMLSVSLLYLCSVLNNATSLEEKGCSSKI